MRGSRAARDRAERLTRYVNALLEKKPTVSLPSAREVLRTKVGDCNEHTALYVAMARAPGIPARIAVGLVFVRGAFYYHAWPEVYLDEGGRGLWLPVDPTLNQFPADATHLRLARGGLDKQTAILPLIGRLKMTVLDLEVAPDSTPILAGAPADLGALAIPIPQRTSCCACCTMIAIHDLVKTYGQFTAVDGVSLDVKPGEIHGFLGPNGAGKTTTLRMIAGLLKPTSGRIVVNGHDLATEPEAAKGSLGFIPDRPFIYEKLTAGEFLRFHGGLYGLDGNGIGERVREMLELFELGQWEHELVESFSHGMKQRLVMSAAFLHRPRAVVVDEPMVGLDPRGARLIKDVFRQMSERGVAILMSTHTLEVAQEMCDRISIILKGRIIASGTVARDPRDGRAATTTADVGVPEADRRQRAAGDRRDRLMCPRLPLSAAAAPLVVAQPRAAARARRSGPRPPVRRRRARRLRRALPGRVLADGPPGGLRRARRLPAAARPVVAVPDVPVVPRVQRRRHGAVDVLSLRRSAPAGGGAGGARRLFHARFVRTVGQASWMVVIFLVPVLMGVGWARCAGARVLCDTALTTWCRSRSFRSPPAPR